MQAYKFKAIPSVSNLGPGFDTLGMALNLYAWIEMGISDQTTITQYGENLEGIPLDKTNLIYRVAQMVFAEAGVNDPELEIAMYSDIPLTRGLGSSASAIVGALVAANALTGNALTSHQLFQMASALEHHPDNVGASLFGGIVVAYWDGKQAEYIRVEPSEDLEVLVAVPAFQLSTEKARKVLPSMVSMQDAVFNISHASLLVAALCSGRPEMIRHAMKDVLHQPYRARLIPGMEQILRKAADYGALGAALSGAGPTMLALVSRSSTQKDELEQFLQHAFQQESIAAQILWLAPSREGATILTPYNRSSTLIENIKGEVRI
ncbi:MAG: homoserine kinase [Paenibacillus sp. RIFOXYA1_FULL_44_5]|nr:MAG: homoserine kinase [Paenibacillus sp. RIFOXYA1_FULL_44_5]